MRPRLRPRTAGPSPQLIDEAGAPHALRRGRARRETSPAGRGALWQDERVPLQRAGAPREAREARRPVPGLVF
ncbi:hypothetical protein HMPREF0970_00648 [Schaalia odontolytica F0309]|uniref:Uncharacterized protein n=1 Tax=Schaalia odontolytica F0309 TaxID=649742 RepID=D4TXI5_9ACTO|nr:hypothetical protein HMPREF0970_00648 [Schaalia odontolytica F0309]